MSFLSDSLSPYLYNRRATIIFLTLNSVKKLFFVFFFCYEGTKYMLFLYLRMEKIVTFANCKKSKNETLNL